MCRLHNKSRLQGRLSDLVPAPEGWGDARVESFASYYSRWPDEYKNVPADVVEHWIYRHWGDVQCWEDLRPLEWEYLPTIFTNSDVMKISHVDDWPETLKYWGDDLIEKNMRRETWLGKFMLQHGTTPCRMLVCENGGDVEHPRERGWKMTTPYQIVEGHMRLAYLQALIRYGVESSRGSHELYLVRLPH